MKKILVIDDDIYLNQNISEVLRLEGYDVHNAFNGQTGIETAADIKPDLIICDVSMPVKNGFSVISELSSNPKTQKIPFIFLTAITDLDNNLKGINAGASDYIFKPFDSGLLLTLISSRIKKNERMQQELTVLSEKYVKTLEKILFITSHGIRKPLASCLGLVHLIDHDKSKHLNKDDLIKMVSFLKPSFTEMDIFIQQLSNYVHHAREQEIPREDDSTAS